MTRLRTLLPVLVSAVFLACQSGTPLAAPTLTPARSAVATPAPASSSAASASPTVAGGGVVGAQSAVARIVSNGTFFDPVLKQRQTSLSGSGFIIDPSGLMVTNNHVVTGGSAFDVYVGGATTPAHAQLLGSSECSDLALMQITGGGPYPALSWSPTPASAGVKVAAVGYPEGAWRVAFGGVTTAATQVNTEWASVDKALEHTAVIIPGSSGGPLLTDPEGLVVGINYASVTGSSRYFAISEDEAQSVVQQLKSGTDFLSIGVNAQAVTGFGVYVAAVKTGSPADRALLQPGDLILELENLPVGRDGTLQQYCSVLHSHGTTAPLAIKFQSTQNGQCYTAEINVPTRAANVPVPCPGASSGSSGGGQSAKQFLLTHAPASLRRSCVTADPDPGASGAIRCTPKSGAQVVFYEVYPTAAGMNKLYFETIRGKAKVNSGDCNKGRAEDYYSVGGKRVGRYACFRAGNNQVILWTDTRFKIISAAFGPGGNWKRLADWFFKGDSGPV